MSDVGQVEFLPPLVERAQRDAPGVRLEAVALESKTSPTRWPPARSTSRSASCPGSGAPVLRQALFRDPYACLMRADHPAAGGTLTARSFSRRRTRWCPTAAATA